ncbi:unnamed protein product [Amoebophrya sp. A120]|nr:unnamed protein product [Amoebophrya sp. A120]|eukprot:GSA120T00023955001.1
MTRLKEFPSPRLQWVSVPVTLSGSLGTVMPKILVHPDLTAYRDPGWKDPTQISSLLLSQSSKILPPAMMKEIESLAKVSRVEEGWSAVPCKDSQFLIEEGWRALWPFPCLVGAAAGPLRRPAGRDNRPALRKNSKAGAPRRLG